VTTSLSVPNDAPFRFSAGSSAGSLLAALLDRLDCGLVAVDDACTLLHGNRAALRELSSGRALCLEEGAVRVSHGAQLAWTSLVRDAAVRQRSRLLRLGDEDDHLTLVAMPVHAEPRDRPTALVMMGGRSLCSPLGLEMLASSHGLTFAERRVLRALIDSQSPKEVAAAHGVAMATVRSQIKSIRDKMGVRSIDALLLRAAEVPPVMSWT
jgi:DNA-binding CsgD family transcriptional regulator